MSRSKLRYFTHNQSCRSNCDYDLKYWRIYYINIKIMTSQQRSYLLLIYFNNKIYFLFSCEIYFWSFYFPQFDIFDISAKSNTLVHSIVANKWAKFGAKIFRHFWDIAIFVLGYFILPHPVQSTLKFVKFVALSVAYWVRLHGKAF